MHTRLVLHTNRGLNWPQPFAEWKRKGNSAGLLIFSCALISSKSRMSRRITGLENKDDSVFRLELSRAWYSNMNYYAKPTTSMSCSFRKYEGSNMDTRTRDPGKYVSREKRKRPRPFVYLGNTRRDNQGERIPFPCLSEISRLLAFHAYTFWLEKERHS